MSSSALASHTRLAAFLAPALLAGVVVPLAPASAGPPIKGGQYRGRDAQKGAVTLAVSSTGENFTNGRFNLTLRGKAGRGSCVGPADVTLTPTRTVQIKPDGTFKLHGTFPFRERSRDPQAFHGTGVALVQGTFSDNGKRVSGMVELTASKPGLACRSGIVHFTAVLA